MLVFRNYDSFSETAIINKYYVGKLYEVNVLLGYPKSLDIRLTSSKKATKFVLLFIWVETSHLGETFPRNEIFSSHVCMRKIPSEWDTFHHS